MLTLSKVFVIRLRDFMFYLDSNVLQHKLPINVKLLSITFQVDLAHLNVVAMPLPLDALVKVYYCLAVTIHNEMQLSTACGDQ